MRVDDVVFGSARKTLDSGFRRTLGWWDHYWIFRRIGAGWRERVRILEPECGGAGADAVDGGLVDVVAACLRVGDPSEPLGGGGGDLLVVDGLL